MCCLASTSPFFTAKKLTYLTSNLVSESPHPSTFAGAETTAKLIKMRVLIVGCRGTGIEIAKNLALQGAGGITLVDPVPAQTPDLGSNFFIFPRFPEILPMRSV